MGIIKTNCLKCEFVTIICVYDVYTFHDGEIFLNAPNHDYSGTVCAFFPTEPQKH